MPVPAVSALRVYAINGRSLPTPLIIILLFLMYTLYDIVSASLHALALTDSAPR